MHFNYFHCFLIFYPTFTRFLYWTIMFSISCWMLVHFNWYPKCCHTYNPDFLSSLLGFHLHFWLRVSAGSEINVLQLQYSPAWNYKPWFVLNLFAIYWNTKCSCALKLPKFIFWDFCWHENVQLHFFKFTALRCLIGTESFGAKCSYWAKKTEYLKY